ncbi:MAG TPA: MFS transporter [Thermoleophilia bacterium]|nr:MFS transporter [Thermoleophilia bacterium]
MLSAPMNAMRSTQPKTVDPSRSSLGEDTGAHPNPWLVLLSVALGMFMVVVDVSILNIALPQIAGSLHAGMSSIQWTLIAYTLLMTTLVPLFGRISDVIGRKRLFILGMAIFTLGSLLAALSPSIHWLIGARLVQAVGGALITTNTLAIIADVFPPGKRGVAMGVQSILVSGGAAIGPTLGGFLVTHFGWEAIFYVNLPVGLIAVTLALKILPSLRSHRAREPLDWPGAGLLMTSLASILLAMTQGPSWGWTSSAILGLAVVGVAAASVFVWWELRARYPLVDLTLFRNRAFSAGQLAGLSGTVAFASMMFLLPFYWQGLRGLSAQQAGIMMLPLPMVLMVVAPISGRLSDGYGARAIASTGLTVVAVALLLISRIGAETPVWSVLVRVAVMGLGLGMFMAPNNNAVMSSVGAHRRGIASGLLATFRFTGQSVGIAFVGAVVGSLMRSGTGVVGNALPSPDRFRAVAGDPIALAALSDTFVHAMHVASLAAIPFALLGVFFSLWRPGSVGSGGPHTGRGQDAEEI